MIQACYLLLECSLYFVLLLLLCFELLLEDLDGGLKLLYFGFLVKPAALDVLLGGVLLDDGGQLDFGEVGMHVQSILLVFGIGALEAADGFGLLEVHDVKVLSIMVELLVFFEGDCHLVNPALVDPSEPGDEPQYLGVQVFYLDLMGDATLLSTALDVGFHYFLSFVHYPVHLLNAHHVAMHCPDHHRQLLVFGY